MSGVRRAALVLRPAATDLRERVRSGAGQIFRQRKRAVREAATLARQADAGKRQAVALEALAQSAVDTQQWQAPSSSRPSSCSARASRSRRCSGRVTAATRVTRTAAARPPEGRHVSDQEEFIVAQAEDGATIYFDGETGQPLVGYDADGEAFDPEGYELADSESEDPLVAAHSR